MPRELATQPTTDAEAERARPPATPAAATLPGIALRLQRSAGNRATGQMLARTPTVQSARVDDILTSHDPAQVNSLSREDLAFIDDDQRRQLITLMLNKPTWDALDKSTVAWIWESYGENFEREMAMQAPAYLECIRRGAFLSRLLPSDDDLLRDHTLPGVLNARQVGRARRFIEAMDAVTFGLFRWMLHQAGNDLQRAYLFKAVAAGRAMDDIVAFAATIRDKDATWLRNNLNVVDETTAIAGGTGWGIQQQLTHSCGPTSVQTVRAENDPIFALWLRQGGNVWGTGGANANMTQQQTSLLTGAGGIAVLRGQPGTGRGAWLENATGGFNSLSGATGVTYTRTNVTAVAPANPANGAVDTALKAIEAALDKDIAVPITIGEAPDKYTHYVVVLMRRGTNFIVHDPWQGVTVTVTRAQFMSNTLAPPMPTGLTFLTSYDNPTNV